MHKLSKKVVLKLYKKKLKLSLAESCTGGMLANNITSVSGSSKVFSMSLVIFTGKFSTTSPAIWIIAILSVLSFVVA